MSRMVEKYNVPYDISRVQMGNLTYPTKELAKNVGWVNGPMIVTDANLQGAVTRGYPQAISFGDALYVMLYLLREGKAKVVKEGGQFDHWLVQPIDKLRTAMPIK